MNDSKWLWTKLTQQKASEHWMHHIHHIQFNSSAKSTTNTFTIQPCLRQYRNKHPSVNSLSFYTLFSLTLNNSPLKRLVRSSWDSHSISRLNEVMSRVQRDDAGLSARICWCSEGWTNGRRIEPMGGSLVRTDYSEQKQSAFNHDLLSNGCPQWNTTDMRGFLSDTDKNSSGQNEAFITIIIKQ